MLPSHRAEAYRKHILARMNYHTNIRSDIISSLVIYHNNIRLYNLYAITLTTYYNMYHTLGTRIEPILSLRQSGP